MKILTGREIKEADLRTIENGPVLSLDLMERAAVALTDRIVAVPEYECRLASSGRYVDYVVFAGRGNNGGDGLAIARLLCTRSHVRGKVSVVTVGYDGQLSADCRANYDRLPSGVAVYGFGSDGKDLPPCLFGDDVIIIDALLGAMAMGDIGSHFPPSDERYKNIDSKILLAETMNETRADIINLDATVILEKIKLRKHIEDIRKNLAKLLNLDISRISVKAKTHEGVDATGKNEAVEAYAVVLLENE